MLVCIIGITTPHETFTVVKKGCWTPFADWRKWVAGKRVTIKLDWGSAGTEKQQEKASDSQSDI